MDNGITIVQGTLVKSLLVICQEEKRNKTEDKEGKRSEESALKRTLKKRAKFKTIQ